MARSSNSQPTQGIPSVSRTASRAGAGEIIAAISGESIVITDVLSSAATTLSTEASGGGTIVAYVPAGSSNLNQGIKVPVGLPLFGSAGSNVTINYYTIR